MAYREIPPSPTSDRSPPGSANDSSPPPPAAAAPASLAAQAIRASSAHRDSSLSSAYGESAIASARRESDRQRTPSSPRGPAVYEYTSMKSLSENEPRSGFWGVLARKAKAILEDEHTTQKFETHGRIPHQMADTSKSSQVANAMSAKAKLLLRELKTVKADLAFAKERCAQLEEENRLLRESRGKGNSREDDDLIRLQLETLLAEKGRLAHENSVFARENRFLREIVEYHQLTMQDVVYVDEGIEEVTEVCPIQFPWTDTSHSPTTHNLASGAPLTSSVVLPESCPIVPTPPMQSASRSQSFKEFDSSREGTGLRSPPASEDAKQ